MPLPFKSLKPLESVVVAGIPIVKRGCLTVAELQAIADLSLEQEELLKDKTALQSDLILKQRIATILLQSRIDKSWTLEQTCAPFWEVVVDGNVEKIEPDGEMLDELFDFFMNEQRRWQDPIPEEATGKKSTGRKSIGS